jgi:hypothetical protein
VVISVFLNLGQKIDVIASLSSIEAIETEELHEHEDHLDDIFRKLFKEKSSNVRW